MFQGKVAVVTGASGGLGSAICRALAEHGARIVAIDVSRERAQDAVDQLAAAGFEGAIPVAADVSSADSVSTAFRAIDEKADRIDILINNAGIREIKSIFDLDPKDWDRVLAVNLSGPYYCAREAALRLRESGAGGAIVNIASVAGMVGIRSRPAYSASKHGLIGLTRNLAFDLAPYKVRANAVAPGLIRTPLTESYYSDEEFVRGIDHTVALGAQGVPASIADAVVFLCSPQAAFVTGITLPVDGGFMAEKGFLSGSKVFTT